MSNDRYERIRKALAMGPTPGPRRVIDGDSHPYVTVALPENEGHRWDDPIICALYEDVTPDDYVGFGKCLQSFPNARAHAALIAACDPDTIRELLEERDALAAENARLREEVNAASVQPELVTVALATCDAVDDLIEKWYATRESGCLPNQVVRARGASKLLRAIALESTK